jgi:autotransporter-associated beta strand protein
MKKEYISAIFLVLMSFITINAQTTYDWLDTAPDNNWRQGAFGARWNPGGLFDEPGYGIIRFGNNHELNMTNNIPGTYDIHGITYSSTNSSQRTINNGILRFSDFGGINGFISNVSIANHIINSSIIVGSGGIWNIDIFASVGSITFGSTVEHNTSKILFLQGNNTGVSVNRSINFNGVISGNGTVNIISDAFVRYNANHTYTGATNIFKGELALGENGSISNSSSINLGETSQVTNVAKLFLDDPDGGQVFANNVTVNNGNSNTRYIGGLNSSGTNTFSGDVFRNANQPLNIEVVSAGGSIEISGIINGTGSVTKIGAGSATLSGNNTYTGNTIVSAGSLILESNLTDSDITIQNGATLLINEAVTIKSLTINAGGILIINPDQSLTIVNTLVNNGNLTLQSTSNEYSSLLVDSISGSGEVTYNRYVNVVGTGAVGTGGNDLVSLPVMPSSGINFEEFTQLGSPTNGETLATNTLQTLLAFGPYDNSSNLTYVNYPSFSGVNPPDPNGGIGSTSESLIKAKGYRAATTSGAPLTFVGDVETGSVDITINTPAGGSQWNLVGNPYPSYVISANTGSFLADNAANLDSEAVAIYGYTSGTGGAGGGETIGNFTIINNNSNSAANIAPGQGFFLAADPADGPGGATITFNSDKRTVTGTDDFILGRNAANYNLRLQLTRNSNTYTTAFYFNQNSTLGLDPGYDAAIFGLNSNIHPIYSHLVEDNTGRAMAIQSLGTSDMGNVSIPLGVQANQGQQLSFSIEDSSLPSNIEVYLDDTVANTSTLLTASNYVLTLNTNVSGTGRFYLRYSDSTLSNPTQELDALQIYTTKSPSDLMINGQLYSDTVVELYDIQGRLVLNTKLKQTVNTHRINVSHLNTGVYVVKLKNNTQQKTQKVIIR